MIQLIKTYDDHRHDLSDFARTLTRSVMAVLNIHATIGQVPLIGRMEASLITDEFPIYLPRALEGTRSDWEEDLRWYVEDYARFDPFSSMRAQSVSSGLDAYGSSLAHSICASDTALQELHGEKLTILVDDHGQYSPRLSRIHWEILECVELWHLDFRPLSVTVVRIAAMGGRLIDHKSQNSSFESAGLIHLLAISARLSSREEIPYRLITRAILNALPEEKRTLEENPKFEIVRPGTLEALEST